MIATPKDYETTFATAEGKRVLADLRAVFYYDLSLVTRGKDGHIDIYDLVRNDGQRSVIVHILRKIEKNISEPKQEFAIKKEI